MSRKDILNAIINIIDTTTTDEQLEKIADIINNKKPIRLQRWRPKDYEEYYYINSSGVIVSERGLKSHIDDYKYRAGNYFQTKGEADYYLQCKNEWFKLWELSDCPIEEDGYEVAIVHDNCIYFDHHSPGSSFGNPRFKKFPKDFLKERGIDTQKIVYYIRRGIR